MANKYALSEATPANTDDALEGPLRIREVKQAYNERLGRDHYMGQVSNPDVIAGGADSTDSGYHRRITITELTSDQGSTVDARINGSGTGVNHGTTVKMAEVWAEKSSVTNNQATLRINGSDETTRSFITDSGTQTLTNKTLTSPVIATVDINSGTIDGTTIGATSESTGKFSTLETTGNTTLGSAATQDTIGLKSTTSGLSETYDGANQNFSGLVGEIRMYGGASAPAGWVFCDGTEYTALQDDAKYAALVTVLGGGSSKNVPDLRGRMPMGAGTGSGLTARALKATGGDETVTKNLTNAQMPRHTHTQGTHIHNYELWHQGTPGVGITYHGNQVQYVGTDAEVWSTKPTLAASSGVIAHSGGDGEGSEDENGGDVEIATMPPFFVVNFIIKY